jgi:hypothetical protein
MEIVSAVGGALQYREREIKEVSREKNKVECRLEITEKEKNLCKQQLELL